MKRKIDILGVKISIVNDSSVLDEIGELVADNKQIQITTPNGEHILLAQENEEFRKAINRSDLAIPDGMSVVKALQKKLISEDINLVSRVTGVDLVEKICEMSIGKKWRVGLLGSSEEVRMRTVSNLSKKYEGLIVVSLKSHKNIKRIKVEDEEILREVNKEKIDVLLVAYGAPEQELWIADNLDKTKIKIAMGVGGTFDFISGKVKRAPVFWQKNGMEWFWRLLQEPWRIKRQIKLVKFWWKTRF